MNPFDEQNQKVIDEAYTKVEELKLRKLYTWYDIESEKERVRDFYKAISDRYKKWNTIYLWVGIGIGLMSAATLFLITHQ